MAKKATAAVALAELEAVADTARAALQTIAAPPVVPDPYPHELPRWLHRPACDPLRVDTPLACEQAFADGWTLRPA